MREAGSGRLTPAGGPLTPAGSRRVDAASPTHRSPLDTLSRLFPYIRRMRLQFLLNDCGGDGLEAIDQILNSHCGYSAAALYRDPPPSPAALLPGAGAPALRSAFTALPAASKPAAVTPTAATSAAVTRALYGYSARGLAFAVPYAPAMLPNLATLGYGYSAMLAAAAAATGTAPLPGCVTPAKSLYTSHADT